MPDSPEMTWDEAETISRELVRELKAAQKMHEACLKAREASEHMNRLHSDRVAAEVKLDSLLGQVEDAHTTADAAEAETKRIIAEAKQRAETAIADESAKLTAIQNSVKAAQRNLEVLAGRYEAEHIALSLKAANDKRAAEDGVRKDIAAFNAERDKAMAERDRALAALRSLRDAVPVG